MKRSCLFFLMLCNVLACTKFNQVVSASNNSSSPATNSLSTAGGPSKKPSSLNLSDSIFTAKVDATKLRVWNIVVGNEQIAGDLGSTVSGALSFEFDGKTEMVEYQICPLDATSSNEVCIAGSTVYYRVRLHQTFSGKTLFKARACVDPSRALTADHCGAWEELVFDSPLFDKTQVERNRQLTKVKADLRQLGLDYRQALADFVSEANACVIHNADTEEILRSKTRVVQQFLYAPVDWFGQAVENLADATLGEELAHHISDRVGKFGAEVSNKINDSCKTLGKITTDVVCIFLKTMLTTIEGFVECISPLAAVAEVSVAIHNVYYGTFKGEGDKLVAVNCLAEQKLQNTVTVIQQQIAAKLTLVKSLKQ